LIDKRHNNATIHISSKFIGKLGYSIFMIRQACLSFWFLRLSWNNGSVGKSTGKINEYDTAKQSLIPLHRAAQNASIW